MSAADLPRGYSYCSNPGCALHWTHTGPCIPEEMCGTPGCTLHFAHRGVCAVQTRRTGPLMADARARAEAAGARPVTVRPDAPGMVWPWRAVFTSPAAAFFGLVLLVLLWLSGCA